MAKKDVSRAKDGKIEIEYPDGLELDEDQLKLPGNPPNVQALPGKTITWLAYFNVKKKYKASKNETVTYKIKIYGLSDFIYWDGGQPQRGQNWSEKEVTGDPAIGREN